MERVEHHVVLEGRRLVCLPCSRYVERAPCVGYDAARARLAQFLAAHPDPRLENEVPVGQCVTRLEECVLGESRGECFRGLPC